MSIRFRHHGPARLTRSRRKTVALLATALVAGGVLGGIAPSAGAQTIDPVDVLLNITGEPGPHRVSGAYFTSPGVPAEAVAARPSILVGPSTPILIGDSLCTTMVSGYDSKGNSIAITAGHCGNPGDDVISADDPKGTVIGTFVKSGAKDNGVILLNKKTTLSRSYNDATITSLGGSAKQVCKTGITTGTSCGPTIIQVGDELTAQICAAPGDSGAPVYAGGRLVGLVSGGFSTLPPCITPLQGPLHSPVFISTWDGIQADLNAAGGIGAGFRLP